MATTNSRATTPIISNTFLACSSSFRLCITFFLLFPMVFYSLKINDKQSKKKFGKFANIYKRKKREVNIIDYMMLTSRIYDINFLPATELTYSEQ